MIKQLKKKISINRLSRRVILFWKLKNTKYQPIILLRLFFFFFPSFFILLLFLFCCFFGWVWVYSLPCYWRQSTTYTLQFDEHKVFMNDDLFCIAGDVGGYMGLLCGMSLITLFEWADFVLLSLLKRFRGPRRPMSTENPAL